MRSENEKQEVKGPPFPRLTGGRALPLPTSHPSVLDLEIVDVHVEVVIQP